MKKFLKMKTCVWAMLTFLTCLVSVSAFAQTPRNQSAYPSVFRATYPGETHRGYCCEAFEASVSIDEPANLSPIVVTWSTSYRSETPFYAGLKLNDGPCVFNGPSGAAAYSPDDYSFTTTTFQWVIMPGDYKLAGGTNVITVCGGSTVFGSDAVLTLGYNTMTAELKR